MLTWSKTKRGRLVCVMAAALIAGMAISCLWWMSPTVTAGDELPKPPEVAPKNCPATTAIPPLPPTRSEDTPLKNPSNTPIKLPATSTPPQLAPVVPPSPPDPPATPPTATVPYNIGAVSGALIGHPDLNPSSPPPPPTVPTNTGRPGVMDPPPPHPVAPETQEIKQLMNQLSQLRADRDKLNLQEQQTILAIKRKVQEQKRALEQLAQELRQLGVDCDETPTVHPVRQVGGMEPVPMPESLPPPRPRD